MAIISEKIEQSVIEVTIKSSNLKSAVYDTNKEILIITFNNGAKYEYTNVPWKLFTKFRIAESQGKFFNENIARKFNYKKIE